MRFWAFSKLLGSAFNGKVKPEPGLDTSLLEHATHTHVYDESRACISKLSFTNICSFSLDLDHLAGATVSVSQPCCFCL